MFDILTNVLRAGVAVVVTPVAVVADIVTLPASAYDDKPAFGHTSAVLGAAGDCIKAAITPKGQP